MSAYLDHNATSPLHPEVLDAMLPLAEPFALADRERCPPHGDTTRAAGKLVREFAARLARLELGRRRHHFGMDDNPQQVGRLTATLHQLIERLPPAMRRVTI